MMALPALGANTAWSGVFFSSPGVYACGTEGRNPIFSFRPRSRGRGVAEDCRKTRKHAAKRRLKGKKRGSLFLRPRRKRLG